MLTAKSASIISIVSFIFLSFCFPLQAFPVNSLNGKRDSGTAASAFSSSPSAAAATAPSSPGMLEVSISTVSQSTPSTIQCDYIYGDNLNECGQMDVVYAGSSTPVKTKIAYSEKEIDVSGYVNSEWMMLFKVTTDSFDLFPVVTLFDYVGDGVTLKMNASCTDGYEHIYKENLGFYCRLNGQSVTQKPVPSPSVSENHSGLFYPLECQEACKKHDKCVSATYTYRTRDCFFHFVGDFKEEYSVEHINPDTEDVIYLLGDELNFQTEFLEDFRSSLVGRSEFEFMDLPRNSSKRCDQFRFMMSRYSSKAVEWLYVLTLPMSNLHPIRDNNVLPPLDGPSMIRNLELGEPILQDITASLNKFEQQRQVNDLKKTVTQICESQVDTILSQGTFNFIFAVAEFNRVRGEIAKAQKNADDIKDTMDEDIKSLVESSRDDALEGVFEASLFTIFDLVSFTSVFGIEGSVEGTLKDIGELASAAAKLHYLEEAQKELTEACTQMTDIMKTSGERIYALSKTADFVIPFIESFDNGQFTRDLSETESRQFAAAYQQYEPPFDIPGILQVRAKFSHAVEAICSQLEEEPDISGGPDVFATCARVSSSFDDLYYIQESLNDLGNTLQIKAKEIISMYLVVKGNTNLKKEMDDMVHQEKLENVQLLFLENSARLRLLLFLNEYMEEVQQQCTLMYYYGNGNTASSHCTSLVEDKNVWNVQQIFSLLKELVGSTSVTSSPFTICREMPLYDDQRNVTKGSLNDTQMPSFFDVESLRKGSQATFRLPFNPEWLRHYGWDAIADGLEAGHNFFVKRIQVMIPYLNTTSSDKQSAFDINIVAGDVYPIVSGKGQTRYFIPSASSVSYDFAYSQDESIRCSTDRVRDFMEPCHSNSAPLALNSVCIEKNGNVNMYLPYKSEPVLPSILTEFKVNVVGQRTVDVPKYANVQLELDPGYEVSEVVESRLSATMCLSLEETKTNSASSSQSKLEAYSKFSSSSNSNNCRLCDPGSFHNPPPYTEVCTKCPPGSYQPKRGRYSCFKCPSGTQQPQTGQTECLPCPDETCCPVEGLSEGHSKLEGEDC
eukprot:Nk52_evm13s165 gene=Nk52_evmTU13s165